MKTQIIVTGGCGYIGSHTAIELIEHNYEVIIFDDLSNSSKHTLQRIESITGVRPTFEQIDLKDSAHSNSNIKWGFKTLFSLLQPPCMAIPV